MISFPEVEKSVRTLKKQLAAGQIDEKTFEEKLLQLIDVAEDGYYWMFGHESERWFRHDGTHWQPDDPGKLSSTVSNLNTPSPKPHHNKQNPDPESISVDWDWLIASLVIILAIGWIVYTSSLF